MLNGTLVCVPVSGGTLAVERVGVGPPVLLSHGWTLDRRVWAPQVEGLSDRFELFAYDRRGFGQSSAPPDMSREPDDIVAIADALGLDQFALIGMSQGGGAAIAAASRHPGRISALILQGVPQSDVAEEESDDELVPMAAMTCLARAGRLRDMRTLWRRHPLMRTEGDNANVLLDAICADYAARDLLDDGVNLSVTRADVARIEAQTLIITGETEPAWRHSVAVVLEEAIPRATRMIMPACGHLSNLCRPDPYNDRLAQFLADTIEP